MKTLLICPAIRRPVSELAINGPLATVPIFGQGIVSHWIEHLAGLGARHIQVIVADRASPVRSVLGNGARWGVQLEVLPAVVEPTLAEAAERYRLAGRDSWLPAPNDLVLLDHLPGDREHPLFESYASWFAALLAWMPRAVTPSRVRVREIRPGVWVGRRAHVSASADLIAPCWIGDQVFVEPGAVVGPGAIVEDRSVIENEARVTQSWIGPDTFIGPLTSVATSLAWGASLTNWRSDSSLRVPDPFLLCSLAAPPPAAEPDFDPSGPPERAAAPQMNWLPAWSAPVQRVQDSRPPC